MDYNRELLNTCHIVSVNIEDIPSDDLQIIRENIRDFINLVETELLFRSHYDID